MWREVVKEGKPEAGIGSQGFPSSFVSQWLTPCFRLPVDATITPPMEALLVDDHPLICEILPAMLKKAMGPEAVTHIAGSLEAAFDCVRRCVRLDLVLLDLGLPGCSGIEALRRFRDRYADLRIVIVSSDVERASIQGAFRAGVVGYIPKTSSAQTIVSALKIIADGGTYVPREALEPPSGEDPVEEFSERQREVLRLILKGLSNHDIAVQLGIAESTVKQHVAVIYGVLGVGSRAEAMA